MIILLAWSFIVLPRLIQSLTAPKYRTFVGQGIELTGIASAAQRGLLLLLLGLLLLNIGRQLNSLRHDGFHLLLVLAPWVYTLIRDYYLGDRAKLLSLVYPLAAIAIWAIRPPLRHLALLGYLTGATAILSMAMAIVIPDKGIYSRITGELISPDKQILPWGILIGPFTDGNNLALFLVLGLPAVLFIEQRSHRLVVVVATTLALVWTSSRSALFALVAMFILLAAMSGGRRPRTSVQVTATMALASIGATMVFLPLLSSSPEAFTNRGYIWKLSLQQWSTSRMFGMGSHWYGDISDFVNPLPDTAFSGHNLFVQSLVLGGLVGTTLLLVMLICMCKAAVVRAGSGYPFSTVHLFGFLVSGCLEIPMGLIDRPVPLPVAIIPLFMTLFAIREEKPEKVHIGQDLFAGKDYDLHYTLRQHLERNPQI